MKKILFCLSLLFSIVSIAQQTLTPVQIAERNKPGTVMIQATYKGTVSAIQPEIDESSLAVLAQQVKDMVTQGTITQDQFWNVYIMTFCRDVDKYMMRGTQRVSKELNTTMVGSGFIVTPDGYVITNAHVVDENDNDTKQTFVQQAFQEIMDDDVKVLEDAMGRKMTDEESKALKDANSWYFSQTMEVGNIKKEFSVVFGISGDKGKIVPMIIPAKLVTQGNPIPGKDVAILKLTKKHTYPTIRMGDDKALRVGDQVYVLGYPAVATFHPLISEESISEASLTRGLVSAKKNMKDGWEVLQTDASITHGNSGGPVMNEQGEVVGLATFGSIDYQRQAEVQGMNFIVPSTIVQEFIKKAKIDPEMSDISLVYEDAMSLFDKSRYKKALEKFQEVKEMNSSFPFIDKMINDTEKNIEKGLDKEPKDMMMYYYIGGGAVLLILVLFLLFRKKKKA
ncbi:MAG: trypsin-like peptidase domain-containing protein [Chitinophagaceae bacterium]|jgi:S1-C subfamily serine protease|nr:trypsin-like peptidase domain-containing protein [Chitinophagaceae bacterium]MBK9661006.1 trypsin-like peptidase domain-containing protein [Chitinophagaceae bacterium]MBK9939348.1 trypsin-like peptidase domain-containing protein [Chitinophagaceae bacterium]